MNDLLIEFYSEEMPASILIESAEFINILLQKEIEREKIKFKLSDFYYSPTRLVFLMKNIKVERELENELVRGPSVKSNEKAVIGFARSLNTSVNNLITMNTPKGEYYFCKKKISKAHDAEVVRKVLESVFYKISWKKSMKWGENDLRWIRPLKNILCIFENKQLKIKLGHIESTNLTRISNQINERFYKIKNINHYFELMKENNIEINQNIRKKTISDNLKKIAKDLELDFRPNDKLLSEVVCLVEKPYSFLAKFKEKYLDLPHEILTTTMIENQKYFPLYKDKENKISNSFVLISNRPSNDKGKEIKEGNERVVNARLEDAAFFWKKDLESDFNKNEKELDRLVFHSELGTVSGKVKRLQALAKVISKNLRLQEKEEKYLLMAARFCKNDLVSQVVKEFPNLQGIIGYYLSKEFGFDKEVGLAIKEHYKPQGPNDNIPETKIAKILSIIDKIDNLVGFFIIGQAPSSSKDPFALRRTAIGLIRIIIEAKLDFDLSYLLIYTIKTYKQKNNIEIKKKYLSEKETHKNLIIFILERYENFLKEKNEIDLVIFKSLKFAYPTLNLRIINDNNHSLNDFILSKKGKRLISSLKRVYNILEGLEKGMENKKINNSLLIKKEELNLYKTYLKLSKYSSKRFSFVLDSMTSLCEPIDKFFENVQINDKDKFFRQNRLILLTKLKNKVNQIADFSILIKEVSND